MPIQARREVDVRLLALTLALVVGCDKDDEDTARPAPVVDTDVIEGGSLDACAGLHHGVYDGDERGTIEADLSRAGVFRWTFLTPSGPVPLQVDLDAGVLTADDDRIVLSGAYDLDRCRGEGTWSIGHGFDGAWGIARE